MCADYGLFWVLFLVYFPVLCLPIKWLQVLNEIGGFCSHLSSPLHILIFCSQLISVVSEPGSRVFPTKEGSSLLLSSTASSWPQITAILSNLQFRALMVTMTIGAC